jgi:hypothetical protein
MLFHDRTPPNRKKKPREAAPGARREDEKMSFDCFKFLNIRLAETETLVTATTERHRRRAVTSRQIVWPNSFAYVIPCLGFRVSVITIVESISVPPGAAERIGAQAGLYRPCSAD